MGLDREQQPRWLAYGVAVLAVAVATGARLVLDPVLGSYAVPFITYFPTVLLVTWFGGLGPGLLSVVLGLVAAEFLFMPPRASFHLGGLADWVALALFAAMGLGIAWLANSQQRALGEARRERQRAERTHRLLASIVESTEDAILSVNLDGTITSWNAAAQRMFGYAPGEVLGRPVSILAVPGKNEMPEIVARIRDGQGIEQYETVRRRKSGESLHVSLTVSPVRDDLGRIVGASKIVRDVTDRRRAEQELRETNETLRRTNEDLERFGFLASHDLQEPLRMITNYGQLLARSLSLPPQDERREFLGYIVEGAQRMRALIGDLLTYTRIRVEPEEPTGTVDLDAVLAAVKGNLKTSIEESGADLAGEPLPRVRGHEAHFLSLFQNLVENAIKYRSGAPPRIRVSTERREGEIHFAVTDNGIGIAPQYRETIFQAFKRLHGSTVPGTGVGLAICRRIVERYGGRIWVEEGNPGGTTFRFALPATLAAPDEPSRD
ncbi:MAG TPA: ATP-binding protein [Candidatus Polarisedimenticolaceae bacterium]|nr:ATP-binding protein [Candidatus Polarisedimenticolaceae bacterium]